MSAPITPNDIRNPARQSGYDHVGRNVPSKKPYQADVYGGKNDKAGRQFKGPRRATALEAAQDYCDYVNGATPAAPALKQHGHKATRTKRAKPKYPKAVVDALEQKREIDRQYAAANPRENFVYCYGETGCLDYVKVGESDDPAARVAEGQTSNPRTLVPLGHFRANQQRGADKVIHRRLAQHHHRGEWMKAHPDVLALFGRTPADHARLCGVDLKEAKTK